MAPRLQILMVAPEVAPLVKVGGLADMVGALAKSLAARGHDVRIAMPRYAGLAHAESAEADDRPLIVRMGGHEAYARVWTGGLPGSEVPVYLLEHNQFFGGPSVYTSPAGTREEDGRRFAFLGRAALDLCGHLGWVPDVVHCHDWPTGLVPVMLNTTLADTPLAGAAPVLTLHNLQHQGWFHRAVLDYAGLPPSVFRAEELEAMGEANFLKGGIAHATKITTVSPTYAGEIQEPANGCGLHALLRYRAADLIGVLNGIDGSEWNPATDPHLAANYSVDRMEGKAACKADAQALFGLDADPETPLFAVVSRLVDQKGLDLLAACGERLMDTMRLQVAVLGTGDPALEGAFRELAARYPGRFAAHLGFDNALAHRLVAGADFLIMPSRFEPCGLSQLYAMAYGTPPVVRATGGLIDTVEPYIQGSGLGTGFVFGDATSSALFDTLGWAVSTYFDRPDDLAGLRKNGMRRDSSWDASAGVYEDVYGWAMDVRRAAFPVTG